MAEITLQIEGMHCGACIRRVTQAIQNAGPFQVEEVRLGAARFLAPDPNGTDQGGDVSAQASGEAALAALAKAGFKGHAVN